MKIVHLAAPNALIINGRIVSFGHWMRTIGRQHHMALLREGSIVHADHAVYDRTAPMHLGTDCLGRCELRIGLMTIGIIAIEHGIDLARLFERQEDQDAAAADLAELQRRLDASAAMDAGRVVH